MLAQAKAGSRQAGAALEQGRAAVAAATAAKDSLPLGASNPALLGAELAPISAATKAAEAQISAALAKWKTVETAATQRQGDADAAKQQATDKQAAALAALKAFDAMVAQAEGVRLPSTSTLLSPWLTALVACGYRASRMVRWLRRTRSCARVAKAGRRRGAASRTARASRSQTWTARPP